MTGGGRRRQGIVLLAVMFFTLLAVSGVATMLRRATVDGLIARNRDLSSRCEALARGGIRLATGLLLQDRLQEAADGFRVDTLQDAWARARALQLETPDGGELHLQVEDSGARLNLNSLFVDGKPRSDLTEVLLEALFSKVVEEMPGPAEEKLYDPQELAHNLMDWVDPDNVRIDGGLEDDFYQAQDPPYRAANRPLLSLDELRLVQGFDGRLVEALKPYVTVYPWARGDGINPNTAPPWVLALIFHGTSGDYRLATREEVRHILDIRESNGILCANDATRPGCTPLREAISGEVYPPPTFTTDVFRITAVARVGDVEKTVRAVVDREDTVQPELRAWQVQ